MQKLNKNGAVETLSWLWVKSETEMGEIAANDTALLPLTEFLNATNSTKTDQIIGFWLDSDADIDTAIAAARNAKVIGINFPVFTDGRGFSLAQALRDTGEFDGELIALGHYMQDQLFYLRRCGFDSFGLRENDNVESMKSSLNDFSESYQAATDERVPLFRRRR